jgi:hypothetical protein
MRQARTVTDELLNPRRTSSAAGKVRATAFDDQVSRRSVKRPANEVVIAVIKHDPGSGRSCSFAALETVNTGLAITEQNLGLIDFALVV